jgi:hypothetical protein
LVSEEKIFEKVYDVRRTPSDGNSSHGPLGKGPGELKMMLGSSLPLVVCRRVHVLFKFFVLVCIEWCPTHIARLTKPGEVGDFFALVSMKLPNFCQKTKF